MPLQSLSEYVNLVLKEVGFPIFGNALELRPVEWNRANMLASNHVGVSDNREYDIKVLIIRESYVFGDLYWGKPPY